MPTTTAAIETAIRDKVSTVETCLVSTRSDHPEDDHYEVTVVSEAFAGVSLVDQHALVHEIVEEACGDDVHALEVSTSEPRD